MPPNIGFRLQDDGKYNMADLMMSIELAMAALSEIASTVVDESVGEDYERRRSRWVAEVEIGIVGRIFQVPKTEVGKTLDTQEKELSEQCAEFVATKMLELLKVKTPALTLDSLRGFTQKSTSLWIAIWKHLEDPNWQKKVAKQNSVVAETLVPKVMLMDEKGRPIGEYETVNAKKDEVVPIPWKV